jgi:hypothetical protein
VRGADLWRGVVARLPLAELAIATVQLISMAPTSRLEDPEAKPAEPAEPLGAVLDLLSSELAASTWLRRRLIVKIAIESIEAALRAKPHVFKKPQSHAITADLQSDGHLATRFLTL